MRTLVAAADRFLPAGDHRHADDDAVGSASAREAAASPAVRSCAPSRAVGIPYAAGVMNLVVISAALSSANTNLYTTTRMLFSLARSGYAPAWVSRCQLTGVPIARWCVASLGHAGRPRFWPSSRRARLLRALRDGRRRDAVRLDRDPVHVSSISARALAPDARRRSADQDAGAPRGRSRRHRRLSISIAATTFFVDGLALHGRVVPAVSARHVVVYARSQARAGGSDR